MFIGNASMYTITETENTKKIMKMLKILLKSVLHHPPYTTLNHNNT